MRGVLITAYGFGLTLLMWSAYGVVPNGSDAVSCLQGKDSCHDNLTCANLFDDMEDYCDQSITTCHMLHKQRCQQVLRDLQSDPHLGTCVCDIDAVECQDIRQRIFSHACIKQKGTFDVDIWHAESSSEDTAPSLEELEAIEHSLDKELSCIGVRQLCLKNMECHEAFKTFQDVCTMKKDSDLCTATDINACFRAIETIRPTGLFDCECKTGMKSYTLAKCERIQARLTHNPCLVSVPYYKHTLNPHETSYKDLVLAIASSGEQRKHDTESTCNQAFVGCNDDPTCRIRLADAANSCIWDKNSKTCDRASCLESIRRFFLLSRPEQTHALLFCRCREGDDNCKAVKATLFPTCSVMTEPPPSCLDIIRQCSEDEDCRTRRLAFHQYCSYDKKVGGCPAGFARCLSSQAGIMGTILTTNCTCAKESKQEQEKCLDARNQLRNDNLCREMAVDDFHAHHTTTPPGLWADDTREYNQGNQLNCLRELGEKIPNFMNIPKVIRRYNDQNECSDVCQCRHNGTVVCTRLPCRPNLSCKTRTNQVYVHGSSFEHPTRGHCRCIRGEVVCAKPESSLQLKPGMFLYVGYSLSDKYLVEGNSGVKFTSRQVGEKFATMLNGDSASQFCTLKLDQQTESNLVFEVKVAENSPSGDDEEACVTPTKMLDSKINTRDNVIVTDAELSIVKVSQILRVFFHTKPVATQQSLLGRYGAAYRVQAAWSSVALSLALALIIHAVCFDDNHSSRVRDARITRKRSRDRHCPELHVPDDIPHNSVDKLQVHIFSSSIVTRSTHDVCLTQAPSVS